MNRASAEKILAGAEKAPPFNLVRLTDPNIYEQTPYSDFRALIIGHKHEKALTDLLDLVTLWSKDLPQESQNIYMYFILSLGQICYGG